MATYPMFRTAIVLVTMVIAGCASRADSVAPIAMPSSNYKGLSCDDTKTALTQARSRQSALTESQNNAATGDAVGVLFVLLPVGSIFGADKEGQLAQAKGEVLALQGAVPINCNENRTAVATPVKSGESISVRLEKIKSLLKEGLISQKEADEKRKAILDSM
jgi:hypothetical protein